MLGEQGLSYHGSCVANEDFSQRPEPEDLTPVYITVVYIQPCHTQTTYTLLVCKV